MSNLEPLHSPTGPQGDANTIAHRCRRKCAALSGGVRAFAEPRLAESLSERSVTLATELISSATFGPSRVRIAAELLN
jgi:hypothetical protein